MDGMYLDCTCHSWQSAMKSLGRKKKIGQHSAMDGMHLDSACHSWQSAMKSFGRKKKNWAALCHGQHAFRFCMLFMAECHEELGKEKEKLGSTLPWTACI